MLLTRFRNILLLAICCGILLALGSCKKHVITTPSDLTEVQKAIIKSDNENSIKILLSLDAADNSRNILLCPTALGNTMGMLISGADGATRTALQAAWGLSNLSTEDINQGYKDLAARLLTEEDEHATFIQGNCLWLQNGVGVNPAYEKLNQLYYSAGIRYTDFGDASSLPAINQWPNAYTWGNVNALNPSIGSGIKLMAVGAAGFQGSLSTAFSTAKTSLQPFTLADGTPVPVQSMYESNLSFGHYADNIVQIADMPYGNGGKYALTIIVPKTGSTMQQLLGDFSNEKWSFWISNLDSSDTYLLRLPRVELNSPITITEALGSIGLGGALGASASYTNLTDNGIKPDAIIQGCYLKVNETGLQEASPANSVTPTNQKTPLFANRPYLMVVREKATNTILMLAEVNNPSSH